MLFENPCSIHLMHLNNCRDAFSFHCKLKVLRILLGQHFCLRTKWFLELDHLHDHAKLQEKSAI